MFIASTVFLLENREFRISQSRKSVYKGCINFTLIQSAWDLVTIAAITHSHLFKVRQHKTEIIYFLTTPLKEKLCFENLKEGYKH